ncbi:heavy metal-responsive transcriptional regulator [Streptomyces gobiensis]|uniref:heavy metal-responsive transcriptional regulator n=1 Tax=Streptomyces gobiensis TaxID=2875706 RepID=UPI001E40ACAE|nr:heavy metal-responsive transcriptional regulator [Streptomyces gobiensis]UGY91259.1 heavy metal-responsive transcriptional regulator [Streptomyces gobiensis]
MRIGELAAQLGINPKTIRFYEAAGLLPEPERTPAGYRIYAPADTERLTFIKTAQRLGLSLDDIRQILTFRDNGERPCGHVRHLLGRHAADIQRRITELEQLRDQLLDLEARAQHLADNDAAYCGIITHTPAARDQGHDLDRDGHQRPDGRSCCRHGDQRADEREK